jgi:tetratricopeptide (TPR) repeat protein
MYLLCTNYEVHGALGEQYRNLVTRYDIKRGERHKTKREADMLEPRCCAACGRRPPKVLRLEAAHINPLAECARTESTNLLLLCRERMDKYDRGCHKLFDQGYASIRSMRTCRERWMNGLPPVHRGAMLKMMKLQGKKPQQLGHLFQELSALRKRQARYSSDSENWAEVQLSIAEVTRRRARKDALKRARMEIVKIRIEVFQKPSTIARYFYERGYIDLLTGNLADALKDFDEGRKVLETDLRDSSHGWRWSAHTCLMAQVGRALYSAHSSSGWSWARIQQELQEALRKAEKAARLLEPGTDDYRHANRWVENCLLHLTKPKIANNHYQSALELWKRARDVWERMDLSTGWDAGFRPHHFILYGHIELMKAKDPEEIRQALAYLVRAIVLLVGLRRQQPEGVRDLLFATARATRALRDPIHKQVERVAYRCVDLSSWFNPYGST